MGCLRNILVWSKKADLVNCIVILIASGMFIWDMWDFSISQSAYIIPLLIFFMVRGAVWEEGYRKIIEDLREEKYGNKTI
jgi:hypothetical protein